MNEDPDSNWTILGGIQCFNGNSYTFAVTGNHDTSATYQWSFQNGSPANSTDSMPVVSFLQPGLHAVTLVVNENGCTSSRTDTIEVYPEPEVVAGPDRSFCEGSGGVEIFAIAASGTPPYAYTWWCDSTNTACGIDSLNDNDPKVNPGVSTWYYVQITDANGCTSGIDSLFVTIHPRPVVDAGPDVALCGENAPCEVLTPSISGSPGPFTYQWIPGAGLNDSTILYPCARPDTTTIYALVATDIGTGCSSDYNTLDTLSTVVVTVHPIPIANAGPDLHTCANDTVQLQGSATGAGPDYEVLWSPTSGVSDSASLHPFVSPPLTTDFSLVVWSNGCPSEADTATVFVHTIPSVDAGWDREICLGETAFLDATAAGDSTASYNFSWSQPSGLDDPLIEDPQASPDATTTYYVVATSTWGCHSAADSVTVYLLPTPVAEAGDPESVCIGDPLTLSGGYFYAAGDSVPDPGAIFFDWSPGAGMADSTSPQTDMVPNVSGFYYLEVRHGTCQTLDSVFVTVIPELNARTSADTNRICQGDSVQLYGVGGLGGASFYWSPPDGLSDPFAQNPMAAPDDTIAYMLVVSESGCADTTGIGIAVLPSPDVSLIHSDLRGCPPHSVSFIETSTEGLFHIWNFGDGSPVDNTPHPVHVFEEAGAYPVTLTVVNDGGCDATSEVVTVEVISDAFAAGISDPAAPANLYLPEAVVHFSDQSTNATGWVWDFGDGNKESGQEVTHTFTEAGTYFVTLQVHNSEGCWSETRLGPYVVLPPELFIPNVFSPNADAVNDVYLVDYQGAQTFSMEIRDRWGAVHYEGTNKLEGWNGLTNSGQPAPAG
ncbi:MAG: PKD domain-containing protein, partial [Bacteroidota bacterium]